MDEREIESIIYSLQDKKEMLLSYLDLTEASLTESSQEDYYLLLEEKEDLLHEIREIEIDIGVYTEMKDKLYFAEIGACGFPCDGRCPQCGGTESYNPLYEVFTGGDY